MASICLNMIVKNEAHVIRRCLDSVLPLIDAWCILDTGSSDGTQDLVREHLGHLPGQLAQGDWKGFAASRNEAVRLAGNRADYLLFMDADDQMVLPEGYRLPALDADCYLIQHRNEPIAFLRRDLVSTRLDWHYVGVLHEYLDCAAPFRTAVLPGPMVLERREGARSQDPRKYEKDAEILEQALRKEPHNARYRFYLAQSYRDAGRPEQALEAYRRRAAMGGWEEEAYVSRYQAARLLEALGRPEPEVVHAYLEAYQSRPRRAEALGCLARYLRLRKQYPLAVLFAEAGMAIPLPDDILFLEDGFHTWICLDEFAVAAFSAGRPMDALRACDRLLGEGRLPASEVPRVAANRALILKALHLPDGSAAGA
jgi:glycosyltransferase involved in cell wall biosynthesis